MSSIPLPALAVKPPEQQDPVGQYAKGVALQGLLANQKQQQQLQPLQLQQAQNNVEIQNQQLQSTKAMERAYVESGGDLEKAAPLAVKYGARPQDIQSLVTANIEQKQKLANLTKEQQAIVTNNNKAIGDHSQALLAIQDPQQRQAAYEQSAIPALLKLGVPANQIPPQVPDEQTLKYHALQAMDVEKQLEQQRKDTQFTQEHGILPPDKLQQINSALTARYQVLNPGKSLPSTYALPSNSTVDDFQRVDKLMEQTEKAQGTQSQRETTNAIRQQTAQLASQAAADRHAAAQEKANKPTADEQRRADLAQNLNENMDQLEDIIKRRPELFGPLAGRWTGLKSAVGSGDPDIAALETIKHQLGMAQISAHGMRSAQGIASAANSVLNDFHNSPSATMSSLQAVRNSVDTFTKNAQGDKAGPNNKQTAQPSGGNVAPEGTVINHNGVLKIKKDGKWVPQTQP